MPKKLHPYYNILTSEVHLIKAKGDLQKLPKKCCISINCGHELHLWDLWVFNIENRNKNNNKCKYSYCCSNFCDLHPISLIGLKSMLIKFVDKLFEKEI